MSKKIFADRYSVRSFSNRKVEKNLLDSILENVRMAPTALNRQPYFIYVMQTEDGLKKIEKSFAPNYGSSTILVVCSDRHNSWSNRYSGQENILQDIGIVAATIIYAGKAEGIDSCCVCNFDPKVLKEELGLIEGVIPECLIYLGYPQEDSKPSERHYQRRKISEFVHYL